MAKVPRWHSVAAVTAEAKARFAVYGWVVAPRVALESRAALSIHPSRFVYSAMEQFGQTERRELDYGLYG